MKHVKLFEAWDQEMTKSEILVGFFADGGKGSHPSIIDAEMKDQIESHPADLYFIETEVLSEMPEALLAIYDSNDLNAHSSSVSGWIIKGISNELAEAIISSGKTDIYGSDDPSSREAFALAGFEDLLDGDGYAYSILAVIPNVKTNTVYWSNNPEAGGGKLGTDYWETPCRAIPLADLLAEYNY
jgi:hypothetical protein